MPNKFCRLLLCASIACFASSSALAGVIMLYEYPNFGGERMVLRDIMPDLDRTDFNDRTESILVRAGYWEVCTDSHFRGHCEELGPGEYRYLNRPLSRSISSLREIYGSVQVAPPPQPAPPPQTLLPPSGRPRAVLYEYANFGGRSFAIDNEVVSNFDRTGFNDRASSIWIEGGYWLFCSDAFFEGSCRTFGPGQYPQLPWDINNKISSGRRIHERYPYNAPPVWPQ